eukprot:364968-Chlamydomonas_euryale.AAC.23
MSSRVILPPGRSCTPAASTHTQDPFLPTPLVRTARHAALSGPARTPRRPPAVHRRPIHTRHLLPRAS